MKDSRGLEDFKPLAVRPPSAGPGRFRLRCLVDLQLGTVVRWLRARLAVAQGHVLDIGAGEAPWREFMPAGCHYQGLDIEDAQSYGMRRQPDMVYYDGKHMPFTDAQFDVAICTEVLEHVPEPMPFLDEVARVLRPGGVLLLTVPWSARRHHVPNDFHRFTPERLAMLMHRAGFEDVSVDERGNDVAVIANKLIVLTIRLLRPRRGVHYAWTIPLAVPSGLLATAMLAAAHVSMALRLGSLDDPLGYGVRATRRKSSPGARGDMSTGTGQRS